MRKIIGLSIAAIVLSGCVSEKDNTDAKKTPAIGLANPASVYCRDTGGTLEIVDSTEGQIGYCILPSGEKIEEWTLYRRDNK